MNRPTLYLLSGLLCDQSIWRHQLLGLAKDADTRALDFRGFDSISSMAQRVLAEAPSTFALAGHSMGARVALEVVRQSPHRVQRLALLDTGTHQVQPGESERRHQMLDLARTQGMRALSESWLPPMLHPDRTGGDPLLAELTAMVERMTPEIFSGQIHALLHRPDAQAVLANLDCPVLIGVGRQDNWSPLAQHQAMARSIPHACLTVFEHSGHMAPMEAPEAVNEALREWLCSGAQHTKGPPSESQL